MRVSGHIRTHVVGYVAVFLALSGTAMALPGTNTVDSGDIVPSGVTTPDLGLDAVAAARIADGTVASADLFDQQVRRVDLKAAGRGPRWRTARSVPTNSCRVCSDRALTRPAAARPGVSFA